MSRFGKLAGPPFVAFAVLAGPVAAEPRLYDADRADQFLEPLAEDIIPDDPAMRRIWADNAAYNAAIFGRPAVLTYNQMHAQAVNRDAPGYVGFNTFAHDRDLAGPGYEPFKTPNADTLYSNAFLDLSAGPVLITVPPTNERYYTVNFLDLFGNATNISARTHGTNGGTYLVATTDWGGEVPEGAELFRVTQRYMWILMRIEVESIEETAEVRTLQDRFTIEPVSQVGSQSAKAFPAPAALTEPRGFLEVLDWIVKEAGVRRNEEAFVHMFRGIGVGGRREAAEALADDQIAAGANAAFHRAETFAQTVKSQNGAPVRGWREPFDIGRYGYNYVYRAGVHSLGLGANVRLENFAFTTFADADGKALDGSRGDYALTLESVPPSDFFWSVTVYDVETQELHPNTRDKYLVSSNTPGLEMADNGSITITFSQNAAAPNAIPIPDGGFYLALRAQGPRREMLTGAWLPSPVRMKPQKK